jgi:aspartyl-tRNA(Asn)/glutamyl-tRNA(Gln) amidotransferase subunit C
MLDKKTVEEVAHLARIELKDDELLRLSGELEQIVAFIDKLKQVDVEKITPMSHAVSVENVLREDTVKPSLSVDKALANAPAKKGNFFVVPKVIE